MRNTLPRGGKRLILLLGSIAAMIAGFGIVAPLAASADQGCEVEYEVQKQWTGGFTAKVTIANLGDAISGWDLSWTFPSNQRITQAWNTTATDSGDRVTASNLSYNATVESAGSTSFGFNGSWSGANEIPTAFTLNGVVCGIAGEPTTPPDDQTGPVSSIGVVPVYASDQDLFLEFYTEKLGMELRFDAEVQPGVRWIEVGLPGQHANIAILAADAWPDQPARTDWMTLHTTDLTASMEELSERGVELSDRVPSPYGDFCILTDPDGQQVVLAEVPL